MNKFFFLAALVVLATAEPPSAYRAPSGNYGAPSQGGGSGGYQQGGGSQGGGSQGGGYQGGASANSGGAAPLIDMPIGANDDTMEGVAPGPVVDQAILDKVLEVLAREGGAGGAGGAGGYQQQSSGGGGGGYPGQAAPAPGGNYGAPSQSYGSPSQSSGGYANQGGQGGKLELGDITQGKLVANFVSMSEQAGQTNSGAGGYQQGGNQGGNQGGYRQ